MPEPGSIDLNAFMAGFGIAEAAAVTVIGALIAIVMLKKLLGAAGW